MSFCRSPRYFLAAAFVSLMVILLLPVQSALAGGCCFTEIRIKSLDTGREVTITGPALTSDYDLSTFFSFADFMHPISEPSRLGPAYEVVRDGWDHLRYYPSVGDQPGAVYYEGLLNGSSEYDHRWFLVPPKQDAALRQALARQGFQPGAAPQSLALIVSGLLLAGLLLAIGSLWLFPLRYARVPGKAWAVRRK